MTKDERKCLKRIAKEISYWKNIDTSNNLFLEFTAVGAFGALSNVVVALYGVDIDHVDKNMVFVEEMKLSIRTQNMLHAEGIATFSELKDVMKMGDLEVMKFLPQCGKKTLHELKDAIKQVEK